MLKNKILALVPLVLLLPIIVLPLSSDHLIFILGGKAIAEGGTLYSDFIDIKQPLIYYFFSLLYSMFGLEQHFYRVFDYVWQSATVLSLIFVVGKIYRKQTITILSAIIYVVLYVVLNYSQTLQIETLVNLPLIWAIYLFQRGKKNLPVLIGGVILGIITGLKMTLVMNFVGIVIFLLFFKRKELSKLIVISISFVVGLILSNIPLMFEDIFRNYQLVFNYLFEYSKLAPSGLALIVFLLKNTGEFLGDFLSVFIVFAMIYGILVYIINPWKSRYKNDFSLLLIVLLFLNFLMVLVEGKLAPYHFSRLLIFIAIMSAIGVNNLYYSLKSRIQKKNSREKFVIALILIFFIAFSPVSRYLNIYRPVYYHFANQNKLVEFFTHKGDPVVNMREHIEVGDFIKNHSQINDKIVVAAIGSNQIYLHSGLNKFSVFGQSQFYLGKGTPSVWKKKFVRDLNETIWLVTQTNDIHPSLTGYDKSSYELLMSNNKFKSLIEERFDLVKEIGAYKIFHKKIKS